MNQETKLKLNSVSALIYQMSLIIIGLILPRYILGYYGSEVNGLRASVNQFLNIIVFLDLGVGSVVQSALFKPLHDHDMDHVNDILSSGKAFFNKIGQVLLVYIVVLVLVYSKLVGSPLDYLSTAFLIVAMSLNLIFQYYYGITYQILLRANQQSYIIHMIQLITIWVQLACSLLLIIHNYPIYIVELISGIIYLARPMMYRFYAHRNFELDLNRKVKGQVIPQKWNGIAQHIAYVILTSTDIVVLSLFSTLENVSIYSIYNMIINGLQLAINSLTSGLQPYLGHSYYDGDPGKLRDQFSNILWQVNILITFVFGMCLVLVVPFVRVFTRNINDVSYELPLFAAVFVISQAIFSLRLPYNAMIMAAGHYRQTQTSAIIESVLNVVISLALVTYHPLLGVAFGTLVALSYRTIYQAHYLSRHILHMPFIFFIKMLLVQFLSYIFIWLLSSMFLNQVNSFIEWFLLAVKLGIPFVIVLAMINFLMFNDQFMSVFRRG